MTTQDPWIKIDADDFARGFGDGLCGYTGHAPADVDGYSWAAGFVEGKAERELAQREATMDVDAMRRDIPKPWERFPSGYG